MVVLFLITLAIFIIAIVVGKDAIEKSLKDKICFALFILTTLAMVTEIIYSMFITIKAIIEII